ncbi:hypothetical protein D3C87_300130 [compost metagenome]
MKNVKSLLMFVPAGLLVVGCGEYKKNPVDDLEELRKDAKVQTGPVKPRYLPGPVVIEKERVVVEETKIDNSFIIISPDRKMTFTEGVKSTFKVVLRATLPDVQLKLTATGLPDGATLTPSAQENVYNLTWTPSLYVIPQNTSSQDYDVKLIADVDAAASKNKENAAKIKGLVNEKEITILLFRNQEPPSNLTVTGLPGQIKEGDVVSFTVSAKVPGIDDKSPQKPRLVVSYDGVSLTAGNSFLELDGSRHVDTTKTEVQYVGNSVWKFTLPFDTKKFPVQPQLAKNGTVMDKADGTRVRLSFKVYSPYGMSTPESLTQLKLVYAQAPVATQTPQEPVDNSAQPETEK